MKISTFSVPVMLVSALWFNSLAMAYTPEMNDAVCKKPKFREFSLAEYKAPEFKEVPPESEFTFTLSVWADKETIKLEAKKQPLPFTVQSTSTYHRVKAKLPASFNGKFVRIDASVKALLGCDDQYGWLVKVAGEPDAKAAKKEADKPVEEKTDAPGDKATDTPTQQTAESK